MSVLTKMIGFVTTGDAQKARAFYGDALGFRLLTDDDFALVFDANGTMLRVAKGRKSPPAPQTVLGWEVDDIHAAIRALVARGVTFEQWSLPFMKQDHSHEGQTQAGGFWDKVAHTVMGHAVLSVVISAGLLILASIPYFGI